MSAVSRSSIHLLVPGLLGPIAGVDRLPSPLSSPLLERCLARSESGVASGEDLESTLCPLFGVERSPGGDFPVAALRRLGDGAAPDGRYWLQAAPVCLRPDQSRLLLFDAWDCDLSRGEFITLGALFSGYLEQSGWHTERPAGSDSWYLSPEKAPSIRTYSLGHVYGRNMDLFLPVGRDALTWHSLLNEIQMLLFDTEVNRLREERGKPPVNGVWISGGGMLPGELDPVFDRLFADDTLAAGLARLSGVPRLSLPETPDQLLQGEGNRLAVYPDLAKSLWRSDPYGWSDGIRAFGSWLECLVRGQKRKAVDEMLIYPCDGRVFRLTRTSHYRFWKRGRPLPEWFGL